MKTQALNITIYFFQIKCSCQKLSFNNRIILIEFKDKLIGLREI